MFVSGGDPAFEYDYFGYIVLGIMPNKHVRFAKMKLWQQIDWSIIKRGIYGDFKKYNWAKFVLDEANNRALLNDLHDMGVIVEGRKFTAVNKHEMVQNTELILQEKLIEWPDIKKLEPAQVRLLTELTTQLESQEELHERTVVQYKHKPNQHDDLFWAFNLALWAAKQYIVNPDYVAIASHKHEIREGDYFIDNLGSGVPKGAGVTLRSRRVYYP